MTYLGVEVKSELKKGSRLETRQIMPIVHVNRLLYEIGTIWSISCHVIEVL
jgi:hypothetical protein